MVRIEKIDLIKTGRDVEHWGGGWIVDLTFGDEMHRSLNNIDGVMIKDEVGVLQAVQRIVNMQIEWQEEHDELMAREAEKNA